jgi:hypothetical protein
VQVKADSVRLQNFLLSLLQAMYAEVEGNDKFLVAFCSHTTLLWGASSPSSSSVLVTSKN